MLARVDGVRLRPASAPTPCAPDCLGCAWVVLGALRGRQRTGLCGQPGLGAVEPAGPRSPREEDDALGAQDPVGTDIQFTHAYFL